MVVTRLSLFVVLGIQFGTPAEAYCASSRDCANGACWSNVCDCFEGWSGPTCAVATTGQRPTTVLPPGGRPTRPVSWEVPSPTRRPTRPFSWEVPSPTHRPTRPVPRPVPAPIGLIPGAAPTPSLPTLISCPSEPSKSSVSSACRHCRDVCASYGCGAACQNDCQPTQSCAHIENYVLHHFSVQWGPEDLFGGSCCPDVCQSNGGGSCRQCPYCPDPILVLPVTPFPLQSSRPSPPSSPVSPTHPSTSSDSQSSSASSKMSSSSGTSITGAIIGVVVGAIAFLVVLCGTLIVLWYSCIRRKPSNSDDVSSTPNKGVEIKNGGSHGGGQNDNHDGTNHGQEETTHRNATEVSPGGEELEIAV